MRHDESTDVYRLKRLGCTVRIEGSATGTVKFLVIPKTGLGIKSLGRVDYLTKYCGYRLTYNNNTTIKEIERKSIRDAKKIKKEPKLTDKTKKSNKKK